MLRPTIYVTLLASTPVLPTLAVYSWANYFPFHALHPLCKSRGHSFSCYGDYITICKVLRTISASRLAKSILSVTNIIVCLTVLESKFQKSRNPAYSLVSSAYRTYVVHKRCWVSTGWMNGMHLINWKNEISITRWWQRKMPSFYIPDAFINLSISLFKFWFVN